MDRIVLSEEEIKEVTKDLGQKLTKEIENDEKLPIVVGVMKGSLNFMMDLIKNITVPIYTDYIQISSYHGTSSVGSITLYKDISIDCAGRTVIVVEDIVDSGLSMTYLLNHIKGTKHPKRIILVALFDKKNARKVPIDVDYKGKVLEDNDFLLGYGLDFNELCRNVPYVYAATPDEIAKLEYIASKK